MSSVSFSVTAGPMKGKVFGFEEHDTFLFGRLDECHCCLPDDGQVSRRHFIMEVNPPDACIRDFGSLNGTYVNGKKIGSREKGETPRDFPSDCDPMEVILQSNIIPLSKRVPEIPQSLSAVIDKAIQASPQDRFQDAGEMLAALRKVVF